MTIRLRKYSWTQTGKLIVPWGVASASGTATHVAVSVWGEWHWKGGMTDMACWVGYEHNVQNSLASVSVLNQWISLSWFFLWCLQRRTHFYKGLTWKIWYFIWCCSDWFSVNIWATISSFKIVGFAKALLAFRFQGQFVANSTWNRSVTQLFTNLYLKNKDLLVQLLVFNHCKQFLS